MATISVNPEPSTPPPSGYVSVNPGREINPRADIERFSDNVAWALGLPTDKVNPQLAEAQGEDELRRTTASVKNANLASELPKVIVEASKKAGRPLDDNELNQVYSNYEFSQKMNDPRGVLEAEISKKYFGTFYDDLKNKPGGSWYDDIIKAYPEAEKTVTSFGQDFLTKQERFRTWLARAQSAYESQSNLGYLGDLSKEIFSAGLYGEYQQRNLAGAGFFTGLLGTNAENNRQFLYRLPLPQFLDKTDAMMGALVKSNPSLAIEVAQKMIGAGDIGLANIGSAITLGTAPGLGTAGKLLWSATRSVTAAAAGTLPARVAAQAATGNTTQAAVQGVAHTMTQQAKGNLNPVENALSEWMNALTIQRKAIVDNPGNDRELSNRLIEQIDASMGRISQLVSNGIKVEVLPEAFRTPQTIALLESYIKDRYPWLNDRIMQTDHYWNQSTNSHFVVTNIGDNGAKNFNSRYAAASYADKIHLQLKGEENMNRQWDLQNLIKKAQDDYDNLKYDPSANAHDYQVYSDKLVKLHEEMGALKAMPGAEIVQDGTQFYIRAYTPVAHNSSVIQAVVGTTAGSKTPTSMINAAIGKFRTPEETFSLDSRTARKMAVYAPNNLLAAMRDELKILRKQRNWAIPGTPWGKQWNDLKDILEFGKSEIDPKTLKKGYTYETPGEVHDWFLRNKGYSPSQGQVESYFAFKRFAGMFEGFKNLRRYANESRRGAETFEFNFADAQGNRMVSPEFTGIRNSAFPNTEGNILLVGGGKNGEDYLGQISKLNNTAKESLKKRLASGEMVGVRIMRPEDFPLRNYGKVGGERIEYVFHTDVNTKPLKLEKSDPNHLPYELDHAYLGVQPNIKTSALNGLHGYFGDTNMFGFHNKAMAVKFNKLVNEFREHLLNNRDADAVRVADKMGVNYNEARAWFKEWTNVDGSVVPAKADINEPVVIVPNGKMSIEVDSSIERRSKYLQPGGTVSNFRDYSRSVDLGGKRDPFGVYSVKDVGSYGNPVFQLETAQTISAVPSLNRSMRKMINSLYMDDYKAHVIDHWIKEAMPHLDALPREIETSPEWYFHHGEIKAGTDWVTKRSLEDMRFKARQLMMVPSKTDSFLHQVSQHMANWAYDKAGTLGEKAMLAPTWALSSIPDAGQFLKSFTYHGAIGLFSPAQLIVQGMTWATVATLSPTKVLPATFGALAHQLTRINLGSIDRLDAIAAKIGAFRPGELKEAYTVMKETGFHIVGGEHSLAARPWQTNVVTSKVGDILDGMTFLFKEGERGARFSSWYTAYKEFRAANPTKTLTNADKNFIFNRAEDLSGNMSVASKSMLQSGVLEFGTQFMSYNLRLAELFTGSRLNWQARARMVAGYWALFGVSAAGLTGFPFGDMVREYATKNGYVVGDKFITTLMMEGMPSLAVGLATDKYVNIGQRFGSPGMDQLRDFITGDKALWELATGASGSTLANMWTMSDGLRRALVSIAKNDDEYFPLKGSDFANMLKVTSVGNSFMKTQEALNSMNWLSRKGAITATDIGPMQAIIMGMTGLQPQEAAGLKEKFSLMESRKDAQKKTEDAVKEQIRLSIRAGNNKDPEQATDYLKRARAILIADNYPVERYGHVFSEAMKGYESMVRTTNWDFYMRNVPENEKPGLRDTYMRVLEMEKAKQGIQ